MKNDGPRLQDLVEIGDDLPRLPVLHQRQARHRHVVLGRRDPRVTESVDEPDVLGADYYELLLLTQLQSANRRWQAIDCPLLPATRQDDDVCFGHALAQATGISRARAAGTILRVQEFAYILRAKIDLARR